MESEPNTFHSKKRFLRYALWGAFILFAASPMLLLAFLKNPDDEKKLEPLRRIAAEMPVPPGFKQLYSSGGAKPGRAWIDISYGFTSSPVSFEEVKSFYLRECAARGWEPREKRGDGVLFDFGDDSQRFTCRQGKYRMTVRPAKQGREFLLSYSWDGP